jgi:predicted GH43/DUF377 family glycosyl hydrolase
MFDSKVVEPGPAPILTKEGILLIYNGADDKLVYRTGWALFDKKDPAKVLERSDKPIFAPDEDWEKNGQVNNVVFVEGLTRDGDKLKLYYGCADSRTGVAECSLTKRFADSVGNDAPEKPALVRPLRPSSNNHYMRRKSM